MKPISILHPISYVVLWLILVGCSPGTAAPLPTQGTLPPPLVHSTQLPQDIIPTSTLSSPGPTSETAPIFPTAKAEFGVEIRNFDVDFAKIQALGAKWVRYNGIIWSDIEPLEGDIYWDRLSAFEEGLIKAQAAGLKMIVVVRSTPFWAQTRPESYCGQVQVEKFAAFGNFMAQLAARYSPAPTSAHVWEIWNEPDVDPSLIAASSPFGCWGDQLDQFYGGRYYGEMLKVVVPAIRAADPSSVILSGGILLNCDPTNAGTPGRCDLGNELPGRFFEGILNTGGGSTIDYVSFHGYASNADVLYSPVYSELIMPSWQARGGVVAGKANFLRETMSTYNVALPLFLTETSFLCPEKQSQCSPISSEFLKKQAEYGAWLAVRNYAENINTIWYTFEGPGWRNSGLLDENQNPRPVYQSIQTALMKINGSTAIRKLEEFPGMVGYEFRNQQGSFYFLAPIGEQPPSWVIPGNAVQATNIFGQVLPLESLSPLYGPVFIDIR